MNGMRIAIALYKGSVSGAYELSQTVSLHLLEFETGTAADEGTHPFPAVSESVQWFLDRDVQAVVVGTIDPDNADKLADRGIHVFTGAGELTVEETIEQMMLALTAVLRGHQHGGCGCAHGESDGDDCCGGKDKGDDDECCGGKGHDDGSECCGGKGHADSEQGGCCGKHAH
jgi:predicted Fe-Mo cluster-binding NifX family protein